MYLNCHSYYSLRHGTLSPEQLVSEAARHGINALALTDINNTTGTVDFVRECKKLNIQPIAGIEFRNAHYQLLYVVIAMNNTRIRQDGAERGIRPWN